MSSVSDEKNGSSDYYYSRPRNVEDSVQIAIKKWIRHQYYIWREATAQNVKLYEIAGNIMRILIIALAASITTMSDIEDIPRTVITIIGGVMTVLTGVEGYLKLSDRRSVGENQKRELLAERDKWGYKWMVEVELEKDGEKALKSAKELLEKAPAAINELLVKYSSRTAEEPKTKPQ
jgi:hypothetical protein